MLPALPFIILVINPTHEGKPAANNTMFKTELLVMYLM